MPTVAELTELYTNFMLGPRKGTDVCGTCFAFTRGFDRCYNCAQQDSCLDAVVPISYSVAHEQLHHALAGYKRLTGDVARQLTVELAAVVWRFLNSHERCLATAAEVDAFPLVTTVPSGDRARDAVHPLRRIIGDVVVPTRDRHERLLARSELEIPARAFDPYKYEPLRSLAGEPVLLIDDTWTTGASAQSAAAALKRAGAGRVAAIVIGRHIKPDWQENAQHLRSITRPFDWERCGLCG